MRRIYTNGKVFCEGMLLAHHCVVVENNTIADVLPETSAPSEGERIDIRGGYLVPGFIDLHNNGGRDVFFTDHLTEASLRIIYEAHHKYGTTHWLPTWVTSDIDKLWRAIETTRACLAQNKYGVLGLHVEGPFLNPAKRGFHPTEHLLKPTDALIDELLERGEGVIKMLTIAPELFSEAQIKRLVASGIVIALGHSNTDYATAQRAFELGVSTVTHLYNAMSPLHHRQPGVVGATLDHEVFSSIVVDGHHVDFAAVRLAYQCKQEHLYLISDAAFLDADREELLVNGFTVYQKNGRLSDANGTIAGSYIGMLHAVRNMVHQVGVPLEVAFDMATRRPAEVLGLADCLGQIAPGYLSEVLILNKDLEVVQQEDLM